VPSDLEKAADWLMHVQEFASAKAAHVEHLSEEHQVFEAKLHAQNVECAQLCLEDFVNGAADDDPRFERVVELRAKLRQARDALRRFEFADGSRMAGEVAGQINSLLRESGNLPQ